jgi:hypothetical protein
MSGLWGNRTHLAPRIAVRATCHRCAVGKKVAPAFLGQSSVLSRQTSASGEASERRKDVGEGPFDEVSIVSLAPPAQPTQHNRLLCQLSLSRHQAPFVLLSNVTPQPAIAIEVSQFANDIQISVTSCVSYGLEPPGRVASPTVSLERIALGGI